MQKYSHSYKVKVSQDGSWLHSEGSNFVFTYIANNLDCELKEALSKTFVQALSISNLIPETIRKLTGKEVIKGCYSQDKDTMIQSLNQIPGMGQTSSSTQTSVFKGTALTITKDFLSSILAGIDGDVAPIMDYFSQKMNDFKISLEQSANVKNFGTVICYVSLYPVLNVPVVTVQYSYADGAQREWVVNLTCSSEEEQAHEMSYVIVNYNYIPPNK